MLNFLIAFFILRYFPRILKLQKKNQMGKQFLKCLGGLTRYSVHSTATAL